MKLRTLKNSSDRHVSGISARKLSARAIRLNNKNQRIVSSMDFVKLLAKAQPLNNDFNGVVKVDPDNPLHRYWLED